MFIDGNQVPDGAILETEICIVGGGVAGIALALEFERHGVQACVLEGGGLKPDRASQSLYRGENVGLPYDLQATRTRRLGGSSNCWGGWIRPFVPLDFEQRDWVPDSGWPFPLTEVAQYYPRASDLVRVNHHSFEPQFWLDRLHSERIQRLAFDERWLETIVSKFSPPTRFGLDYRQHLTAARAKVLLNATATRLDTTHDAATVTGVHVATLGRKRFFVQARRTVLAAGGIENARLLLLSNQVEAAGLGNRHDVVGRYFMEHPRIRHGQFIPKRSATPFRFYDARHTYHNPTLAVDGTSASAHISLAERVQREEHLVQCRTYMRSCRVGENEALTERFHDLYNAVRWQNYRDVKPGHVAALAVGAPNLMASLLYRKLKLKAKSDRFQLESVIEPVPDRDSRITLSANRDSLGLNQAQLDWRVGETERRTHARMLGLIKQHVESSGLGRVELDEPAGNWQTPIIGCNHHMGTTRMHLDPRRGVVDADCKVHGVSNLYVAGSSIFPTCGNDMPTLTIVALTLRLADHIWAEEQAHGTPAPAMA